ncbi:oligogalacturonate-specific porin KdgM family protein [Kosakonia sp. S42]|uniref:oligogalacturonate-specific porin KdgM family protein n=1 Tax=Kosakonia sp. S42 TaxID=2767458 RepID=UPI00190A102B|nr:oligogalacturonate-specific porin KdgM family protein [Kosakonia sp. S42]MBK0019517.1 porin OmpL [Kosakonia sp. S42]
MKNVSRIAIASMAIYSAHSFAAGPWIEGREAYNTASRQHEFVLRGVYNFENGAGIMLTNSYNFGKYDQLKHSYNELESWYPLFKPTTYFTVSPALVITDSTSGSTVSPYTDFNYKFTSDFNVTFRYRYNNKNYDTPDLNGKQDTDSTHQFVMYWNYKFNNTWAYTFEPDYYIHINDYHSHNDKDHNWELNNKLTYTLTEHWKPYVEASWLDRWNAQHREAYRLRVGMRYYF